MREKCALGNSYVNIVKITGKNSAWARFLPKRIMVYTAGLVGIK